MRSPSPCKKGRETIVSSKVMGDLAIMPYFLFHVGVGVSETFLAVFSFMALIGTLCKCAEKSLSPKNNSGHDTRLPGKNRPEQKYCEPLFCCHRLLAVIFECRISSRVVRLA